MADVNPLAKAYPATPTSCSRKVFCIAGILTAVYGIDEIPSHHGDVACIWLLNPRHGKKELMEVIAYSIIDAWNQHLRSSNNPKQLPGLIAVAFDQRNHGSREVEPLANQGWRGGNANHALDMFSIYNGTALDTSHLMNFLPSYAFPSQERTINKHLVLGVSLGGHAAWQVLFNEPRVSALVSIVGCPDYYRLMEDRARLSKLKSQAEGTFRGSRDFSGDLIRVVDQYDPAAQVMRGQCSENEILSFWAKDAIAMQQSAVKSRLSVLKGKRVLNLSGREDKLVPYRCSEPFVTYLARAANMGGFLAEEYLYFVDKVLDGVGHEMTPAMAIEVNRFVIETLSSPSTHLHSKESKI